jgi:hypothetical protein
MEAAARRGAKCMGAASTSSSPHKPFQSKHPSSYVLQIRGLRIRNLLTYDDPANEDSGWIELGRRTLIVGPNGSGKTNIIRALRLSGWWEELLRNDIEIVYMNSKYNLKHYKGLLDELKIPYLAVLDGDARKNPLGNEPDDSICVLKPPSEGEGCVNAVIHEGCRYVLLEPKELEGFLGGLGLDVKGEPDPEEWYELIEKEVKNNPDFNRKFECAGKILSQLIDSALNGSSTRMLSGRLSGLAFMGTRSPAASYHRGIARGPRYPTSPISPSSLLTLSLRIE